MADNDAPWEARPFKSSPAATPNAGFVVKTAGGTQRHFVNVCSHPSVGLPINAAGQDVSEEHLRLRGIDNLRVPLLTGTARTHVLPGGEGEAICVDVVFCEQLLAIALVVPPEDGDGTANNPPPSQHAIQLGKFVRLRLVELALTNAEEELGYKLSRNYTLPRSTSYRGGVSGSKTPVPMPALRQLTESLAAEERRKALKDTAGPWRSKRREAGLDEGRPPPRIEEIDAPTGAAPKPASGVKKGFLTGEGTKGSLYPNGSTEGTPPEGAGDPLGWMPKGLRSRVKVVDTATMSSDAQKEAILQHATNPSAESTAGRSTASSKELQLDRSAGKASGAAASMEREPAYELVELVAEGQLEAQQELQLLVRLPLLESLEMVDVEISDSNFNLHASGTYKLEIGWPKAVSSERAKAKFVKKSRSLKVTVPLKEEK